MLTDIVSDLFKVFQVKIVILDSKSEYSVDKNVIIYPTFFCS